MQQICVLGCQRNVCHSTVKKDSCTVLCFSGGLSLWCQERDRSQNLLLIERALGFFPCWMCNSHETLLPHLLWSPPRSLHSTLHHYAQNTPIHLPLGGSSSSELTRDLQPHQTWHCDRVWGFSANTCRVKLAAVLCHYPTYEEQKWWCCLEVRCCSLGDRYAVYC